MNGEQTISITYEQATSAASAMRTEADTMEDALNSAAAAITRCVQDAWGGDSGVAVDKKVSELKSTFVTFKDAVYNYAAFIDSSVEAWKATDAETATAVNQLASSFNNVG